MEDGSSGIDINPDSSADGAGNSKLRARAVSAKRSASLVISEK